VERLVLIGEVDLELAPVPHHNDRGPPDILVLGHADLVAKDPVAAELGM
jgi:hypothetical protein